MFRFLSLSPSLSFRKHTENVWTPVFPIQAHPTIFRSIRFVRLEVGAFFNPSWATHLFHFLSIEGDFQDVLCLLFFMEKRLLETTRVFLVVWVGFFVKKVLGMFYALTRNNLGKYPAALQGSRTYRSCIAEDSPPLGLDHPMKLSRAAPSIRKKVFSSVDLKCRRA